MARRGGFIRLVCAGRRSVGEKQEVGEGWLSGTHQCLPGYHAERKVVLSATDSCTVSLRVLMGEAAKPVYSCKCVCQVNNHGRAYGYAARPWPVIEKFLVLCGARSASGSSSRGKRWTCASFFGLDRDDVACAMQQALLLPPVPIADLRNECESECTSQQEHAATTTVPGTRIDGSSVRWAGVVQHGKPVDSVHWLLTVEEDSIIHLRDGYESHRKLSVTDGTIVDVRCQVVMGTDGKPLYKCTWPSGETSDSCCNNVVQNLFASVDCFGRRKWEYQGIQFFGLHLLKVPLSEQKAGPAPQCTPTPTTASPDSVRELTEKIRNIRKRSAGPSSELSERHRAKRMKLCEDAVNLITFGDLKDFIKHLMESSQELVDAAVDSLPQAFIHLFDKLVAQPAPVVFSAQQSGELLAGAHSLSERAYINTRKILLAKNVHLSTYAEAVKHLSSLDVGKPATADDCQQQCEQCFSYDLVDTLHRIGAVPELFNKLQFPTAKQQRNLLNQLQSRRPDVYADLQPAHRTIILRQTGDNYRAALKRQPTQQMSVSILNMKELVNSPLGQFVLASWRGGEGRPMLRAHMATNFAELEKLAKDGIVLKNNTGEPEHFNVVVLYVADFSHTKEVLGRVQVNAEQGCPYCDRPASTWHLARSAGTCRDYKALADLGTRAEEALGVEPDKESAGYKAWYQKNQGQTGRPLLNCLFVEANPPCALHLHLSLHRRLWKKISAMAKTRNQEDLLPKALASVGCTYLAFQVEHYFKSKKKHYDGSDTLKMTGVDCIRLEEQIEKFALFFVRPGQTLSDRSCVELRHLIELFQLVRDITREMRALETTMERINTFRKNVDKLMELMVAVCPAESVTKVPYLHVLRDHVANIMEFWFRSLGWGYGYFSCMASEHLNKVLKEVEYEETSFGTTSLHQAVRKTRLRAIFYPATLFTATTNIICSACKQAGHNRRNELCPAKRPHCEIESSDDEVDD